MLSMNDSDEEFYSELLKWNYLNYDYTIVFFYIADVKPIVSLDESPSPTNSNMDENSSTYSNSFGILENSLTSNMPNNSSKTLPHVYSKCVLIIRCFFYSKSLCLPSLSFDIHCI